MDVQFKTARPDAFKKGFGNGIAFLGNYLKRSPHAVAFVQIHQLAAKSAPFLMFDVMGHEDAALVIVRPEPDEGDALSSAAVDGKRHQLCAEMVHRFVHGP